LNIEIYLIFGICVLDNQLLFFVLTIENPKFYITDRGQRAGRRCPADGLPGSVVEWLPD
jgi:hypothetical protein